MALMAAIGYKALVAESLLDFRLALNLLDMATFTSSAKVFFLMLKILCCMTN